jgi:hypothetical protein
MCAINIQGLKDLMSDFGGVKIYIERDFTKCGQRKVILHSGTLENRLQCKVKIAEMSNDPKYFNISTRPAAADPTLPTDVPDDISSAAADEAADASTAEDVAEGYDGSAFGN